MELARTTFFRFFKNLNRNTTFENRVSSLDTEVLSNSPWSLYTILHVLWPDLFVVCLNKQLMKIGKMSPRRIRKVIN